MRVSAANEESLLDRTPLASAPHAHCGVCHAGMAGVLFIWTGQARQIGRDKLSRTCRIKLHLNHRLAQEHSTPLIIHSTTR
jgi:hypothetical protein